MRGAARLWLVVASMLMAAPLMAQSSGPLPGEDRTYGSVPPAPPPERRYAPPPFPKFSPTPPKARHIRVAPKAKVAAKSPSVLKSKRAALRDEKRAKVRKVASKEQRLSSREIKDQRWCGTLTKKQLSRNAKCRKVLDKQEAAKRVAKPAPAVLTKADRKDEIRCGKLSLNQVLRDARCRKVAERHLSGKSASANSKASTSRTKAKASAKSRPPKKRSRR